MLTLISRLVSHLPVGRKLLLIYLLDFSAVLYVSSIMISEKYIAINFARKEVEGTAYVAPLRDTLLALPVPLGSDPAPTPPLTALLDAWREHLAQCRAGSRHRHGFFRHGEPFACCL